MKQKQCHGFSLIEVTIALGIAAFCLTTLMGLIPLGLISNHRSNSACSAADVACILTTDFKNAPDGPGKIIDGFVIPQVSVAAAAARTSGTAYYTDQFTSQRTHFSPAVTASAQFLVSVSMQAPQSGRIATNVDIKISWPARAAPGAAEGMIEVFTALDRN